MTDRLLNLRVLPDSSLDDYMLVRFEGREAISEPFDYRLELITTVEPDLSQWIGKLCEFSVAPHGGVERMFAGRIYAARRSISEGMMAIHLHVGPAYQALAYARATHFVQDKTSLEIFDALTAEVTGLVKTVNVSPAPPKRGYSVRYDEGEIEFLGRLLAQDGIMYFFKYDRNAGAFRHKMVITTKPADYVDIAAGLIEFLPNSQAGAITMLEHRYQAGPRKHSHVSFNVNKLDTPFVKATTATENWGGVYSHAFETIGFEAVDAGDIAARQTATDQRQAQSADRIEGRSTEPTFMAGGRVEITGGETIAPKRVVLTSVQHTAHDPWMLQNAQPGTYSNTFTALDAGQVFRPDVGLPTRVAPGPLLGVIASEGKAQGEAVIDDQWRVPVAIANARDYSGQGLPKEVWLPVQQQWAHSTHGAQFFPRIGTRVIIDFLYGNPDLPFISGTVYTPSQPYPFDPTSMATQSGWRSISDKNGSVVQEFRFEDKPGAEEVYLHTGRDYRREVDQDDWGTVKRDQTLAVERDQKLTVTRDRTIKVDGKQTADVTGTRTTTVIDKNLLESKTEIEFKVGPSTIKLTMTGIEITAPTIKVKASAMLDMDGGGMAGLKAATVDVKGSAMLTLNGGVVMIN